MQGFGSGMGGSTSMRVLRGAILAVGLVLGIALVLNGVILIGVLVLVSVALRTILFVKTNRVRKVVQQRRAQRGGASGFPATRP